MVLYIRNAIAQDWGAGFGARPHHSGIRHSAYLSKQGARCMAPGPLRGAYRGATGLVGGGVMQHAGYELPRKSIPRTPVNKGKKKGRRDVHSEVPPFN